MVFLNVDVGAKFICNDFLCLKIRSFDNFNSVCLKDLLRPNVCHFEYLMFPTTTEVDLEGTND